MSPITGVNGAAEVLRNISSDFCKKCVLFSGFLSEGFRPMSKIRADGSLIHRLLCARADGKWPGWYDFIPLFNQRGNNNNARPFYEAKGEAKI